MAEKDPPKRSRSPRRLEFLKDEGAGRLELLGESPQRLQFLDAISGYAVEQRGVPSHIAFEEGVSALYSGQSRYHLAIAGESTRRLFRHIGWGNSTEDNLVEQGGLLLGRVYEDRERDLVYGLVEDVIPARLAQGSTSHLLFSASAWKEMLDYIDRLEGTTQTHVIGWYHTHPGNLDVFMSGTDQDTQRRLFHESWHFSVVLNPQRKKFRVYHGADAKECRGNIVERRGEIEQPSLSPAPIDKPAQPPESEALGEARTEERREVNHRRALRVLDRFRRLNLRTPLAFLVGFLTATLVSVYVFPRGAASSGVPGGEGARQPRASQETAGEARRLLKVTAEASFLRGSDPESAKEVLSIHPGAILRVVDGPDEGWYLVQVPGPGWVRQEDVSQAAAGGPPAREPENPDPPASSR